MSAETPGRARLRRFWRHRLAVVGMLIMLIVTGLALSANYVAPRSPTAQQVLLRLKPPGFKDNRSGRYFPRSNARRR